MRDENDNGRQRGPAGSSSPVSALAAGAPVLAELVAEAANWALFLDIDGTLVDLAPTPDAIDVPVDLGEDLLSLLTGLGGAMALVTGRGIAYVDGLFYPHRFPIAGLHGAELRQPNGHITHHDAGPSLLRAKEMLHAEARDLPSVIVEDKGAAVALHFRQSPQYQDKVEALMRNAAIVAGPAWTLQFGKMLIELKPAAANKGEALTSFMGASPFLGRRPIAVGDDLTDEDMFAAALAHGGQAIRIGGDDRQTLASGRIATPAQLRAILAQVAHIWQASQH